MPSVAVLIPHYRSELKPTERASLARCADVLGHHPLILVLPASIDATALLEVAPGAEIERFDDACLSSVRAYNALLLDDAFYARFAAYDYMLIHQLDAFVFHDALADWCGRGYDYVGAPWLRTRIPRNAADALRLRVKQGLYRRLNLRDRDGRSLHCAQLQGRVGNGGFSLRRIEALRLALRRYRHRIGPYRDYITLSNGEDVFFSIEVNRHRRVLRIPSAEEAAYFAWEWAPQNGSAMTGGALPFGCHGWDRLNGSFWQPVFAEFGVDLQRLEPAAAR